MPKKKVSKKSTSQAGITITQSTSHDDLPATVGLVKEVRAELVAEIQSVHQDMSAMEGRLNSRIDQVVAGLHRTQALMEEQRGENKVVLDGIKSVMERQDRAEGEAREFRHTLQILVTAKDRTTTQ